MSETQPQLRITEPDAIPETGMKLQADVVVIGLGETEFSATLSGDVISHKAHLNVRVVDLGSGEVVETMTLEKIGKPSVGPKKAAKAALKSLAKALKDDLAVKVKKRLGF